jgi:hypothetical protein
MKLVFIKKTSRNQLIITRDDGAVEIVDLGPSLPFHDLAHYVVEKHFQFDSGFYGHLKKGYSVAQLSDKNIIKTLPQEAIVAEIFTRALQTLASGACALTQFTDLIEAELDASSLQYSIEITSGDITDLLDKYKKLEKQWVAQAEGNSMQLLW